MKTIDTASGKMNKRGQITIPKKLMSAFQIFFGTHESITFDIKLLSNGTIELTPVEKFPKSFFMQSDSELAQSVARAYSNKEPGEFATDEQIDNLLKDINHLSKK